MKLHTRMLYERWPVAVVGTTQEVIAVESIYLQAALPTNVLNGGSFACRIPRSLCAGRKLSLKENLVCGFVDLSLSPRTGRKGETERKREGGGERKKERKERISTEQRLDGRV